MQNLKGNLFNVGILVAVAAVTIFILGMRAYLPFAVANSTTTNVVATANVEAVCYIDLSVNSIDFGSLFPTQNTPTTQNVLDIDNGGNVAANVIFQATTWNDISNTITGFGASNTTYSNTYNTPWASAFGDGNYLTTAPETANGISVPAPSFQTQSTNVPIYFGLAIPPAQTAGQYNQIIYIENSC